LDFTKPIVRESPYKPASQVSVMPPLGQMMPGVVSKEEPPALVAETCGVQVLETPSGERLVTGTDEMTFAAISEGLRQHLGIDVGLAEIAKWFPQERLDAQNAIRSKGSKIEPWLAGRMKKKFETAVSLSVKTAAPGALKAALDKLPDGKIPEGPPLFASANKGPGITPDFERIVETVYAVDAWREFEDLERNIEIGDGRGDYATVREHLDGAERRARRAHALYLSAKLELLKFETECEKVTAAMRQKATDALQDEKRDGDRRKAITDADVRAKMAEMFPEEFGHQEIKLAKLKGAVAHLERIADLWKGRPYTASTILSTLRK